MVTLVLMMFALAQQPPSGFVTIAQGSQSSVDERKEAVVRTADEWRALWASHGGRDAAQAVERADRLRELGQAILDLALLLAQFLELAPGGFKRLTVFGVALHT